MRSINALSLAPDINNWLANSDSPRILHIFENACNLINERKEVLSIVTPQIGDGPFNLVLEDHICFTDHLNLESSISISPDQLHLGDVVIHTSHAKLWNPRPDWEGLHAGKGDIRDQLSQLLITNYPRYGSVMSFAVTQPYSTSASIQSVISNLSSSLAIADTPSSLTVAKQLAGRGAGLTPSGDDFIMGAIYATWIIHPPGVADVLAQAISNTAALLTTSLSAAWLRSAGKGEAGILWHEFFDALVFADSPRIHETVKNILAIGETSGADALAGFISVFASWMNKAGSSHG